MAEAVTVVERVRPGRVVFYAIAELRILDADPTRLLHRRFALRDRFADSGATTVFLDTRPDVTAARELEHIAHGRRGEWATAKSCTNAASRPAGSSSSRGS